MQEGEWSEVVAIASRELARAQVTTIRLKLLKIGTVILRNTRRIRLLYASDGFFVHLLEICHSRFLSLS